MARTDRLSSSVVAAAIVLGSLCAAIGPAAAADPAPTTTPTTVAGTPPATPAVPTDEQIAAKQKALDQARIAAAVAAQAYTDAEAALGHIQSQVQDLEARIPKLQARIKVLKKLLADRAAVLYRGEGSTGLTLIDEVSSTGDLLAGGRIARLADAANKSTDAQMDELDASKKQIERDRDALETAKTAQERLVAETDQKAQALTAALAASSTDLQVAQAQQSYARYMAALAAQAAAAAAAASTQDGQKPAADPALAAKIPVMSLVCPVDGVVTFSNDFGQPRSGWRVHQGTDIFAARGTPDVAVGDGIAKQSHNTLGGNALWIYTWDGNAFYYAHMDAYEGAWDANGVRAVKQGEVVGYVGNTGNAAGGPTHTHFEVHPDNIGPINPYPLLREMCAVQAGLRPPPPPPPPPPETTTTTTTTLPSTTTTTNPDRGK
jgi:murein DD-endopeptidase MepM/ murein hydrolase activator NlpD